MQALLRMTCFLKRSFRICYGSAHIPAGVPRYVTTNLTREQLCSLYANEAEDHVVALNRRMVFVPITSEMFIQPPNTHKTTDLFEVRVNPQTGEWEKVMVADGRDFAKQVVSKNAYKSSRAILKYLKPISKTSTGSSVPGSSVSPQDVVSAYRHLHI